MTDDATDINAILAGSPGAVTIDPGEYRISVEIYRSMAVTIGSPLNRISGRGFEGVEQ